MIKIERFEACGYDFFVTQPGVTGHFRVSSQSMEDGEGNHNEDVATAGLKILEADFEDTDNRVYDVIVIQTMEVEPKYQRQGVATAIVSEIAQRYPHALFEGSNASSDARNWHKFLNKTLPTRMILLPTYGRQEQRVRQTPGLALN